MKREEEKQKAIEEEFEDHLFEDESDYIMQTSKFKKGIEWADQHPREGLWDAEKVIEWLKNNAFQYMEDNHKYGEGCEYSTTELIEDLTKVMEE